MTIDPETLEVRNLKYNGVGTIDCEIKHWSFGWIPFSASPEDPEDYGKKIYEYAVAGKWGPIAPYVPPTSQEL